jgi:hypothetical protein
MCFMSRVRLFRLAIESLEERCLLTSVARLLAWGENVYQQINASLQVSGSHLYAETASLNGIQSGGDSGFAYVWPEATMFRALDDLVSIDPTTYTPVLRAFSDELYARYWQTTAPGGYRSGVSSGATLFYDDNGHVAVALAEAYDLTGDPVYLSRAVQTYQFVLSGEDMAGGGGIYFSVPNHTSKDAISTLQAVRAGLLLYQITGEAQYLCDATRLYTWAATHIQQPNGLFYQGFALTGPDAGMPHGTPLINAAGIGVSSNLLFYDTTGDLSNLQEAQLIGRTTLTRYFNAVGAINDEGYWDFELVDGLDALCLDDRDPTWLHAVTHALTWLHANREDPNGHYGRLWARENYTPGTVRASWNMIDQAAVAESYLHTAAENLVESSFAPLCAAAITRPYEACVGAEGGGTGFYVTPAFGPRTVTGIQVATVDDSSNRHPLTVSVDGSNATRNFDAGATWPAIANSVALGFTTNPGGPFTDLWSASTMDVAAMQ